VGDANRSWAQHMLHYMLHKFVKWIKGNKNTRSTLYAIPAI